MLCGGYALSTEDEGEGERKKEKRDTRVGYEGALRRHANNVQGVRTSD